jgi:hypothetical protein
MIEYERVELRGDRKWNKENVQGQSAGHYVVYPTTYYQPFDRSRLRGEKQARTESALSEFISPFGNN